MPAPGFGFSVGDFVAVTGLIWQLCQALDDSAEDAKLFKEVQLELFAFNSVILQVQQSVLKSARLSDEVASRLEKTLHQIKATAEDFYQHIRSFKSRASSADNVRGMTQLRMKVTWSFSGKKKVEPFRAAMQSYSAALTLIMQALN
jgi:hypothetical protein